MTIFDKTRDRKLQYNNKAAKASALSSGKN